MSTETGVRLDIHAALADWQRWVAGMDRLNVDPRAQFRSCGIEG